MSFSDRCVETVNRIEGKVAQTNTCRGALSRFTRAWVASFRNGRWSILLMSYWSSLPCSTKMQVAHPSGHISFHYNKHWCCWANGSMPEKVGNFFSVFRSLALCCLAWQPLAMQSSRIPVPCPIGAANVKSTSDSEHSEEVKNIKNNNSYSHYRWKW